jgi:hypothetical protein
MKYTKPVVVKVADALRAIQTDTHKPDPTLTDNCGIKGTTVAYEADE